VANSEAIAWYVEESQRLLEDQQRRAESLRTRGGQIAGFGALFLALIGSNTSTVLHEAHGGFRVAIGVVLFISAVCLVVSVAVAVLGMTRHRTLVTISADEIANFMTDPFLEAPDLWRIQVRSLRALKVGTENAQKMGNDAVKSITVSLYAFLAGLAFAVVAIGIFIVEVV
jgi:hypothetical protein